MVYRCNSKCDIDASKKIRRSVIRDLYFSGTSRTAPCGCMVCTCNSKCDIDASKKTRKFVIRDLNFSGTDRLAVPGFMVHTCISKCNRDASRKTKIQNVVEMQARKEDQLRITAVLKSSHIKISGRLICIESKNTKSDNVVPNETIDHTNTL